MHLCTRSFRSKETLPLLQSLSAPRSFDQQSPDRPDANSSLQLQHNLGSLETRGGAGHRTSPPGGACTRASLPQAHRLDESFSHNRKAPSSKQSLPEPTPLQQVAVGEGTEQTSLAATNLPLATSFGRQQAAHNNSESPSPNPA